MGNVPTFLRSDTPALDLVSLVTHPREDLAHELKAWLDLSSKEGRANLAQAMLALANHGGGYVVLGIDGRTKKEAPRRPKGLEKYDQDAINGIVERFAEPMFHCQVHMVRHPVSGAEYPVVVVPGGHRAPIRAKRGGPGNKHVVRDFYYIRRPGPKSEPPQSGQEWNELMGRCLRAAREELLESMRAILSGAAPEESAGDQNLKTLAHWIEQNVQRWQSLVAEHLPNEQPSRYANGYWTFAYIVVGQFGQPNLRQLLDFMRKAQGRETGWPPWIGSMGGRNLKPYWHDDLIECWLKDTRSADAAHSDFWRASPKGMLFLLRGYQEDSMANVQPGTTMEYVLPIWRVGECLLHAERMARLLGAQGASILFQVDWHGLAKRNMVSRSRRHALLDDYTCIGGSVSSGPMQLPVDKVGDVLPEVVQKATSRLYIAFDFIRPAPAMYAQELAQMRKGPRSGSP